MYKVVIVDDEPIIAEGLSKSGAVGEIRLQDCGYSGQWAGGPGGHKEEQPNMVISDISMPGMDSLKMIAALR